jgi:urease gamma subunit
MSKTVAVKAYSVGGQAFWRSGKMWDPNGSVHLLEPLDLARLRQEPRVVVVSVADSVEAITEADTKAKETDARLLAQSEARAERRKQRGLVVEYPKPEAVKSHVDEIKADMGEDSTTNAERSSLKDELSALEQKLKHLVETQKSSK